MTPPSNRPVAVVIGGSGGIGAACCRKFLSNNFSVVSSFHTNDTIDINSSDLPDDYSHRSLHLDINASESVSHFFRTIYSEYKRIDILIISSGKAYGGLFSATSTTLLEEALQHNFISEIRLSQVCSRYMMKKKRGSIVFLSSSVSYSSDIGTLSYGCTKAALNFAVPVIARELSSYGIIVNAIAPGVVDTPMLDQMSSQSIKDHLDRSSDKRLCSPFEVASLAYFLSVDSGHLTGQIIRLDGGQ